MFFKKKSKKRFSLLLEILLACTLLTLVAGPLMRKPIELYKMQKKALRDIEKERLADLAFAKIKINLFQSKIPWDKLPSKKAPKKIFPLEDAILQIPNCQEEKIAQRALIKCRRQKVSLQGELVRLLEVEIEFAPFQKKKNKKNPSYVYYVIVKKMSSSVFST